MGHCLESWRHFLLYLSGHNTVSESPMKITDKETADILRELVMGEVRYDEWLQKAQEVKEALAAYNEEQGPRKDLHLPWVRKMSCLLDSCSDKISGYTNPAQMTFILSAPEMAELLDRVTKHWYTCDSTSQTLAIIVDDIKELLKKNGWNR